MLVCSPFSPRARRSSLLVSEDAVRPNGPLPLHRPRPLHQLCLELPGLSVIQGGHAPPATRRKTYTDQEEGLHGLWACLSRTLLSQRANVETPLQKKTHITNSKLLSTAGWIDPAEVMAPLNFESVNVKVSWQNFVHKQDDQRSNLTRSGS